MNWSVAVDDVEKGRCYPLPEYYGLCKHSPDGFSWGYNGSGPSQLAFAIIHNVFHDITLTQDVYMRFREAKIATLDKDSDHIITEQSIREWVAKNWQGIIAQQHGKVLKS